MIVIPSLIHFMIRFHKEHYPDNGWDATLYSGGKMANNLVWCFKFPYYRTSRTPRPGKCGSACHTAWETRDWTSVSSRQRWKHFFWDRGEAIHCSLFDILDSQKIKPILFSRSKLLVGLDKNTKMFPTLLQGVDTWWSHFKEYTLEEHNKTWLSVANEQEFPTILSDFLYSSHGAKYKSSFKFAEDLVCNQQAPEILASKFTISYVTLTTPDQHIPATSAVKSAINEAGSPYNFRNKSFTIINCNWLGQVGRHIHMISIIIKLLFVCLSVCV